MRLRLTLQLELGEYNYLKGFIEKETSQKEIVLSEEKESEKEDFVLDFEKNSEEFSEIKLESIVNDKKVNERKPNPYLSKAQKLEDDVLENDFFFIQNISLQNAALRQNYIIFKSKELEIHCNSQLVKAKIKDHYYVIFYISFVGNNKEIRRINYEKMTRSKYLVIYDTFKKLNENEEILIIYAKCFRIHFRDIKYKIELEFKEKIKKNKEEIEESIDDKLILETDPDQIEETKVKGVISLPITLNKFLKFSGLANFFSFEGKWKSIDTFNIISRKMKTNDQILKNSFDLKSFFLQASYVENLLNVDGEKEMKTRVFGICEVMILKRVKLYFRAKLSDNYEYLQLEFGFDIEENNQNPIFIKKVIDKILDTYQRLLI